MMKNLKFFLLYALICIFCISFVSCDEDVDIETDTSISYTLTISPDLLKFVTPQVSYIDENGELVTITGMEELDGKVLENSSVVSSGHSYAGTWSAVAVSDTGYKCWTLKMRFKHLSFHSHMTVKYLRNEFIEDTTGKVYDFHHNINTSVTASKTITTKKGFLGSESVDLFSYSDSHISVTVGDFHIGDDVETYLLNLMNNPDQAGYYIDEKGDLSRKDDTNI